MSYEKFITNYHEFSYLVNILLSNIQMLFFHFNYYYVDFFDMLFI
jgi:hypothetical protein